MRTLFTLLLVLVGAPLWGGVNDSPVTVTERKDGGRIVLVARNSDLRLQRWVQVNIERPDNISVDRALPLRALLQPGESRDMATLSVANPGRNSSYGISYGQGFGNPDAMPDLSVAYLLPFENGGKHVVGQGYLGTFTHQGLYALDFNMDEGTTICAARDGIIADLKEDSDMGGASPAYARLGNYIDVLHSDGTWATYAHLKNRGVLVRQGDRVRAGDPIALSGQTGMATGPHLHFSVQKPRWDGEPETFSTSFAIDASHNAFIEEGKYYYSWHPDGAPFERVDASAVDEEKLAAVVKPIAGGKVRFREEKIDNRVLLYCANPLPHRIELKIELARQQNVEPSQALPLIKIVPAHSEIFLLSILMKGQSSYQTSFSYRPLRDP